MEIASSCFQQDVSPLYTCLTDPSDKENGQKDGRGFLFNLNPLYYLVKKGDSHSWIGFPVKSECVFLKKVKSRRERDFAEADGNLSFDPSSCVKRSFQFEGRKEEMLLGT